MTARYQIVVNNQAGAQVALLTTWYSLEYVVRLNDVGTFTLEIDGDLDVVSEFVVDGQIEIRRRDLDASPVIDWYTDFRGFQRTDVQRTDADGRSRFASLGVDLKHLLQRRGIAFRDTSGGARKTGPGETVMKDYVNENAGPGATAPPRIFAGVTTGLTVQASGGAGSSWAGDKPYRPLFRTVREIADATGVDFDIVSTGALTYEFQAKAEPLGVDRTTTGLDAVSGLNAAGNAPLVFSLDFGNMEEPALTTHRLDEVNAAIILGQGQELDRVVIERTSSATADSPLNRIESFRNANQEEDTAGLNAVGDAMLQDLQARETFFFKAMQIPSTLYGRDYFVGDLVTMRYKTIERNLKITAATIKVQEGIETIDIEVSDVP